MTLHHAAVPHESLHHESLHHETLLETFTPIILDGLRHPPRWAAALLASRREKLAHLTYELTSTRVDTSTLAGGVGRAEKRLTMIAILTAFARGPR